MEESMTRSRKVLACLFLFAVIGVGMAALAPSPALPVVEAAAVTRCGWFVNPTPGNAWLIDAAGEWIIGAQGRFQAEGEWPEFIDSRWVATNGNYGYGCACMKVDSNARSKRITRIYSANSRPLSSCRNDRAIKNKEPN
jgi:hypothetical protein